MYFLICCKSVQNLVFWCMTSLPKFQSWPPGWVTLPHCLGLPYWYHQPPTYVIQSRHICWYATNYTLFSHIHTTIHFTALYYTTHILHSSMTLLYHPKVMDLGAQLGLCSYLLSRDFSWIKSVYLLLESLPTSGVMTSPNFPGNYFIYSILYVYNISQETTPTVSMKRRVSKLPKAMSSTSTSQISSWRRTTRLTTFK